MMYVREIEITKKFYFLIVNFNYRLALLLIYFN